MNGRVLAIAALLVGLLWLPRAAYARDHVLILTISNYPQQPLMGVQFDADNALALARGLGYDTSQAQMLRNEQLTAAGLRAALGRLSAGVALNDRVFVYYSGHGASLLQDNQCVQSLVGQDGGLVGMTELQSQMEAIKLRTRDVFVMVDACHSGGLRDMAVHRSLASNATGVAGADGGGLQPKLFTPRGGQACHEPVNFGKSWMAERDMAGARAVLPKNNFTFIAAANEREVALDDSDRGGLATVNLLACLKNGVPDLDGSGQVSVREWIDCAQNGVGLAVPQLNAKRGSRWTAHTLEGYGNVERGLPIRALLPDTAQPGPARAELGSVDAIAERTLAAFQQLAASANGLWAAGFDMPSRVRMGTSASVQYHSAQGGYLSIIYLGSDRKHIDLLARNVLLQPTAGKLLGAVPIEDCPGGCAGANHLLFILSQRQIDTDQLLASAQSGKLPMTAQSLVALHCAFGSAAAGCGARLRNATALQLAPDAPIQGFAAQLVTVVGY